MVTIPAQARHRDAKLSFMAGTDGVGRATVRPATEDDLDHLIELLWSVAAEGLWVGTEVPFDRPARRSRLEVMLAGPASTVLVASTVPASAAGVVGSLTVSIAPYGVADIGMLVARGWRGKGLGTALLRAGISWAGSAGAHKVALEVWPHNEAAIALYRKAGFVEEGRKVYHYRRNNGEVWDALLMGRVLP